MAQYNGWSNRETWLVNVWFGDMFSDMDPDDVTADYIRETVDEYVSDQLKTSEASFVLDMLDLGAIDYDELEKHYKAE